MRDDASALDSERCRIFITQEFRKKEYVLNEALSFTDIGLKKINDEIEVENKRI